MHGLYVSIFMPLSKTNILTNTTKQSLLVNKIKSKRSGV